jgi:hypothetical protein
MAYIFRGFFVHVVGSKERQQAIDAVHQQWPFATIRLITDPFSGIGVQLPEESESIFRDDQMFINAGPPLLSWSKQFSETTLLYLETECFAGVCNYWGYVCRRGEILHSEVAEVDGAAPLIRLLRYLEVESSGYFAPLEDDFFEDSRAT